MGMCGPRNALVMLVFVSLSSHCNGSVPSTNTLGRQANITVKDKQGIPCLTGTEAAMDIHSSVSLLVIFRDTKRRRPPLQLMAVPSV